MGRRDKDDPNPKDDGKRDVGRDGQCLNLAHSLRSNIARASLQPLYRAAIEKHDSTCQDLAQRVKRLATAPV